MKAWWINLSKREKQIVLLGGIFIFILFIYFACWLPFNNKMIQLRKQIVHNQALLLWMQSADKQIDLFNQKLTIHSTKGSILGLIQGNLNKSSLHDFVTQLRQGDHYSVQITFQKVNFDALLKWIITICQEQNLLVKQISVTPADAPGIVFAELVLTR